MPRQRVHAHITNIVPLQIQHARVHVAPRRVARAPPGEPVENGGDARRPKRTISQIQTLERVPRPLQISTQRQSAGVPNAPPREAEMRCRRRVCADAIQLLRRDRCLRAAAATSDAASPRATPRQSTSTMRAAVVIAAATSRPQHLDPSKAELSLRAAVTPSLSPSRAGQRFSSRSTETSSVDVAPSRSAFSSKSKEPTSRTSNASNKSSKHCWPASWHSGGKACNRQIKWRGYSDR